MSYIGASSVCARLAAASAFEKMAEATWPRRDAITKPDMVDRHRAGSPEFPWLPLERPTRVSAANRMVALTLAALMAYYGGPVS